jgi:polygalacturonase
MKYIQSILVIFVISLNLACSTTAQVSEQSTGWQLCAKIQKRIVPPVFPDKDFVVTKYGAVGDGKTDCTQALKDAITDCSKKGGGRVVVPEGVFLTGAIHLLSNVNLYVSKNAVIKFSTDKSKYLPVVYTRWEGVECMNYSALIYAYGVENIAITGEGVLDGQGSNENWWSWCGKDVYGWKKGMPSQKSARDKLNKMGEDNVPLEQRVFGEGSYLRPNFFQPYKCKNILVEGVTFKNSPMWFHNPVLSENFTIKNVTIDGLGPNNDGCDPESSKDILIEGCSFNTGDDCIAIKSGRNNDGRRVNVACENLIIRNCTMKDGHGGVVIGSEISGSVRNVFAENCSMDSPLLERALRIKTNSVRGGVVENVYCRNIAVGQVKEAAVLIDFNYEEGDSGNFPPTVKNVFVENMVCKTCPHVLWLKGYQRSPIQNVTLMNCVFNDAREANIVENVNGLKLKNVIINGKPADTK